MAAITVKNMPHELCNPLKPVVGRNRCSVNSEIVICTENTVSGYRVNTDEILVNARRLRQLIAGYPIGDEDFNRAKAEDRL